MLRSTPQRSAGGSETVVVAPTVDANTIISWLNETEVEIGAQSDYLTQLDAAIGDNRKSVV